MTELPANNRYSAPAARRLVDRLAHEAGFHLVAITDAADFAKDRQIALRRIDDGLMNGLPWFTKSRVRRGSTPQELLPGACSIITLGLNYRPADQDTPRPGHGLVARYAQGRDYHRVMKRRMRQLVIALSEYLAKRRPSPTEHGNSDPDISSSPFPPGPLAARWYVDDGPMLDRAAAARAGLGWFGKNGNILNPTYGSWILLGQIITNLALPPDAPLLKTCGACTRCIPACPTDAIVAPYVVDNQRCISYLTIEHKGVIPRELRPAVGNWVFGCDICQEVCPVNRKAIATDDPNFGRRDLSSLALSDLLNMTEDEFRQRFAGTPLMRAKRVGMQRNACVALGNLGDTTAVPALSHALQTAAPLVRQHAAWALGCIGGAAARTALSAASKTEPDAAVLSEIHQSLSNDG